MLTYERVLERTNYEYARLKAQRGLFDPMYCAPEAFPKIESDQVKALAKILVDEINEALEQIYPTLH